jgi:hypothetical protein
VSHADDQLHAMETGSITPMGEVQQVGLLGHGLKTNPRGRRRGLLILALGLGLVGIVVAVAVLASL